MKTLMIHDIRREYFNLPLEQYRLTFDDGLFTQYYYYPLLKNLTDELVFFISSSFVKPGQVRPMFSGEYLDYTKSKKYMYRAFVEDTYDEFMRDEELQLLSTCDKVCIGAHSHFHDVILTHTQPAKNKPLSAWKKKHIGYSENPMEDAFSIRSKLTFQGYYNRNGTIERRSVREWEDYIKYDTDLSLQWFNSVLGFTPDIYCFPFNEHNKRLIGILKTFGFRKFFSARPNGCLEVSGRTDIDAMMSDSISL